MPARRFLRHSVLALGVVLAGRQAGKAEPTAPVPPPAQARYDQGQSLQKEGKVTEAIAAYEEAIGLGMQLFPRVHLKQAGAYLELKDYETAVAKFTKFIDGFGLEDSCRY